MDLQPQDQSGDLLVHYGSPLVTNGNTVVVPVKTGANDGFRVEGHKPGAGTLKWFMNSDYSVPSAAFTPSFGPTLSNDRVVAPAAGGTVLIRRDDDNPRAPITRVAFYGIDNFKANRQAFSDNVKINTPITSDRNGNLYFGFLVLGSTPVPLQSGLARIGIDGAGTWIPASVASGDPTITKVNMNCAPALSKSEKQLYVGVSNVDFGYGYLVELDATTLQPLNKVRLKDPASGNDAFITDQSSATPTVGPNGDVFFGVLENPFPSHNDRGWLHFSGNLRREKIPGSFGWDDTASIVDASLVPFYHGPSSYLVMTKYNNYASRGGDGVNKLAILDPAAAMPDPVLGNPVMNEVLTIAGITPDPEFVASFPNAVREWCINTAAVDPFTKSVLTNSEDGRLYRWDLTTNSFSQIITLTGGIGEAYTPTLIGNDGTVYAINRAILFAIGR